MKRTLLFLSVLSILGLSYVSSVWGVSLLAPSSTVTPTPASSIEYALPFPGILPDHNLYPLKLLRDKILRLLTRDPIKKIELDLLLADKRLVMGQLLWEKAKWELSLATLSEGEKLLFDSALNLVSLQKRELSPPGLSDKVELAAKKHIEVITSLSNSTADPTYQKQLGETLGITNQTIQQISANK